MHFIPTYVLAAFLSGLAAPSPSMIARAEDPARAARTAPPLQEAGTGASREPGGLERSMILKAGTEVSLAFAQSLSSKHASVGERVELRVTENVLADGAIVIPAGARVLGTVVEGKKDERYGNAKRLAVRIDYISVKGRRIGLSGEQERKARTSIGPAAAATLGLGLSGLLIYMGHREAWIREGTPAVGYVDEDLAFPPADPAPGPDRP